MSTAARLAPLLVLALQACVVVPHTREVYDPECRVLSKQMVLETTVVGHFGSCAGDACVAMMATMGFVTAATAVVSGSVALVGNVVYWFERQGRCERPTPTPLPPR